MNTNTREHVLVTEGQGIDDLLGDGSKRFFGSGYRRVRQLMHRLDVSDLSRGHTTAILDYPEDWSVKKGATPRVPHLSTIDGIAIGVRAASCLMAKREVSAGRTPRAAELVRLRLKAGSTPIETLDKIPVEASYVETSCDGIQHFIVTVGSMSVDVQLRVGSHPSPREPIMPVRPDELVNGFDPRYWDTRVTISDTRLDMDALLATATIGVHKDRLAGNVPGTVTAVESIVVVAQLVQALLYQLDGIDRSDSDTLWMRWTEVSRDPNSCLPAVGTAPARLELQRVQVLTVADETWRTGRLLGHVGGFIVGAAVAHKIP
jgi:hypothetical protein